MFPYPSSHPVFVIHSVDTIGIGHAKDAEEGEGICAASRNASLSTQAMPNLSQRLEWRSQRRYQHRGLT